MREVKGRTITPGYDVPKETPLMDFEHILFTPYRNQSRIEESFEVYIRVHAFPVGHTLAHLHNHSIPHTCALWP